MYTCIHVYMYIVHVHSRPTCTCTCTCTCTLCIICTVVQYMNTAHYTCTLHICTCLVICTLNTCTVHVCRPTCYGTCMYFTCVHAHVRVYKGHSSYCKGSFVYISISTNPFTFIVYLLYPVILQVHVRYFESEFPCKVHKASPFHPALPPSLYACT
jgi:hypothetical protein